MKRKWLIGIALLSIGLLVWANVRKLDGRPASSAAAGPANAPIVKVQTVAKRPIAQTVISPGTVEAGGTRELRAPFATSRLVMQVAEGDKVKAGQILAQLDATEMQTRVASQEAQVVRLESSLAQLQLEHRQAPMQLAQKLEAARGQVLQAEESLAGATQSKGLPNRLEQARNNLAALQGRSANGSAQLESARQALVKAEEAYRAAPLQPGTHDAYQKALETYDEAVRQNQESARQTAVELRRAYDELEAAEREYAQFGEQDSRAVQLGRSQVESAKLALQMAEMQAETGGNVAQQIRSTEADLAAARLTLANLQQKLHDAVVRAPADATVLSVGKTDQPIQEGQVLLKLGSLQTVTVKARVDEVDIAKIQPGHVLSVRSNANPNEGLPGKVTRVSAQMASSADGRGGSYFEVFGEATNTNGLLRSGMSAEVRIETAQRPDAIAVGLAALREVDGRTEVLVVKDFKVEVRPVTVGLRTQSEAEIIEGLEEGETIVVGPFTQINALGDGSPVRVEESKSGDRGDQG